MTNHNSAGISATCEAAVMDPEGWRPGGCAKAAAVAFDWDGGHWPHACPRHDDRHIALCDTHWKECANGFYHDVRYDGNRLLVHGPHWNTGPQGVLILLSVTPGVDWRAYVNGLRWEDHVTFWDDLVTETAAHGGKLPEAIARACFPWVSGDLRYAP